MGLSDATQHHETVKFTSQISASQQRPWLIPFIVVMGVSFCARLLFVVVTSPVWWPDSIEYMHLARLIGQGNLAADQGIRTPGYSLFMLLNGFNLSAIRVTQMVIGLAVTSGIFWIIWTLNHKPWLASLGALLYGLNIAQIRLESSMITETLATALLLGALVSLVSLRTCQRRDWWKLLAVGVFAGLLPLVRPLYVFVPLLFAIPVASAVPLRSRRFWLYFLPAILPVVVWVGYLGVTFDYVGLQTASGFGWTNHAGAFMKDAPQEYATIRDIYLEHEAAHQGIWSSIPDMQKATGQTYPELSKTVQSLSFALIASHPSGYARQVASAFVGFWKGLSIDKTWNPLGTLTGPLWRLSRYLWLLVGFCFIVVVLGLLAARLRLIRLPELPWPTGWMVLTVLISGILQALVEYGSASRFGMPTQPFVSVVVMLALGAWVTGRRREEAQGGGVLERAAGRRQLAPVDVDHVREVLEHVIADADREDELERHHPALSSEYSAESVRRVRGGREGAQTPTAAAVAPESPGTPFAGDVRFAARLRIRWSVCLKVLSRRCTSGRPPAECSDPAAMLFTGSTRALRRPRLLRLLHGRSDHASARLAATAPSASRRRRRARPALRIRA